MDLDFPGEKRTAQTNKGAWTANVKESKFLTL